MPTTFDRDAMARWYAGRHLGTDSGVEKFIFCQRNRRHPRSDLWRSIDSYRKRQTWSQSILA